MTDNEIVQALEKSLQMGDAPIGAHWGVLLTTKLLSDLLDLIKRQRNEIDRHELVLSGVMHFVDKWLDDEELEQDETQRAITMREKTLRIVEEQQAEIGRFRGELAADKNDGCKWISVKDRLPQNFVSVLGYMTDAGEFPAVRECYTVGNAFFFPALSDVHPVSHWMPMPEPPKGE